MAVAVERDRDRRVAQIGAQSLRVQSGGDPDAGEGMAALVETEWLESSVGAGELDCFTPELRRVWGLGGVASTPPCLSLSTPSGQVLSKPGIPQALTGYALLYMNTLIFQIEKYS